MSEKSFVQSIQKSASVIFADRVFIWKTNDRFTLGIPDLFIVVDGFVYAIEAKKAVEKKTGGFVIKHPFSGPQISTMRQLHKAGAFSFGAIQMGKDWAYLVHPDKVKTVFEPGELDMLPRVYKTDGLWRIDEWPKALCLTKRK